MMLNWCPRRQTYLNSLHYATDQKKCTHESMPHDFMDAMFVRRTSQYMMLPLRVLKHVPIIYEYTDTNEVVLRLIFLIKYFSLIYTLYTIMTWIKKVCGVLHSVNLYV